MATPAPPAPDNPERVAELQTQFPDTPLDPGRLRRFLRARDGNVPAAAALLKADIEWRASRPIPPPPSSFADRLAARKAYFHLADKGGMPIIVVIPGRHKNTEPVEENVAFAIYLFELAIACLPPGVERIMILIDFEGFGMHCLDYGFLRQAINVLQNDYPERLGRVCLLDPPFIFRAAWAVIRPWLDEKTRSKVLFLSGDYKKELLGMVDAPSLPAKYGGSSSYNYDPTDSAHLYGLLPPNSPPPPGYAPTSFSSSSSSSASPAPSASTSPPPFPADPENANPTSATTDSTTTTTSAPPSASSVQLSDVPASALTAESSVSPTPAPAP